MSTYPGTGPDAQLIPETSLWPNTIRAAVTSRLTDYVRLCRPGIALMTSVSVAAGFVLAATSAIDLAILSAAIVGVSCFVAASSVLNQTIERDTDARMRRTVDRPVVTGSISAAEGWLLGIILAISGTAILVSSVNVVTAVAAAVTMLIYVFAYTPAKRRTALCTTIGAIPGAMPPVLGWLACRGDAGVEALALFAIFFVWQFPHFLAIGWLHQRDYQKAGLRMLPSFTDGGRSTAVLAVAYAIAFVPVCCVPRFIGMAGTGYLLAAILLSVGYLMLTLQFAFVRTDRVARCLMTGSLICLPSLLLCLVFDYVRLTS
jgi:heme o synthase